MIFASVNKQKGYLIHFSLNKPTIPIKIIFKKKAFLCGFMRVFDRKSLINNTYFNDLSIFLNLK